MSPCRRRLPPPPRRAHSWSRSWTRSSTPSAPSSATSTPTSWTRSCREARRSSAAASRPTRGAAAARSRRASRRFSPASPSATTRPSPGDRPDEPGPARRIARQLRVSLSAWMRSRWVPRLLLGAGAVGLGVAIVSLAIGTGGPQVIKIRGAGQVQELLGGIQQDGSSLGPPEGSVTISVFTDLQCSTCDAYEIQVVDPLIEEYARTDRGRLEFHNYSLGQAETTKAAYAATAAGQQDREWQFVELFFRNQDAAPGHTVTDEFLDDLGNTITDLDLDAWRRARESAAVRDRVEADGRLAADLGLRVNGPSIVVDGPAATKVLQDGPSKQEVDAAVAAVGTP